MTNSARIDVISSLLVANRGEIACRIFRTCRELGVTTVAVHSDADEKALHVRSADAAVRLPGSAPADTYLRADLLIEAARAAGADAVHPGYGFLSENAGFARAVIDAGLLWVGPSPEAIEAMASKTRAKELMAAAGVPLFPALDPQSVSASDLPVIVKAAAGGGGRGMRVVREFAALPSELASARAEARSAFGDGEVFAEPYVEHGRHVEVQVLADTHGTVWVLGTRDCSLQRRHQKVIEEAPAPGIGEALRHVLHEAAAAAARAIGYTGAGTVEFLVRGDEAYFLEMNTRLQVEHPVTEAVFGVDLVAWQLRVAEGARLEGEPPSPRGHAVEARVYAEDPARNWLPGAGKLHRFEFPSTFRAGSLRVDTGYAGGDHVPVHYDALLAKVVAWAPDRAEAIRLLSSALERAELHGPVTNRELLVRSLRHPRFAAADLDTGFYERNLPALVAPEEGEESLTEVAALVAALSDSATRAVAAPGAPLPVARSAGAWRNLPSHPQQVTFRCGEQELTVRYRRTRSGTVAEGMSGVRVLDAHPGQVMLEVDGVRREFTVRRYGDAVHVDAPGLHRQLTTLPRFPAPVGRTAPGSLLAPMPGTVVRIAEGVKEKARVQAGEPLIWMEAMKMEHRITAPASGVLRALHAEPGLQVEAGAVLAVVDEDD